MAFERSCEAKANDRLMGISQNKVTVSNVQSLKASSPMEKTELGMEMLVRALQLEKAEFPMTETELGMCMLAIERQP